MLICPLAFRDPIAAFQAFAADAHAALLDGFATHGEQRVTTIAADPRHVITVIDGACFVDRVKQDGDAFTVLDRLYRRFKISTEDSTQAPFSGGLIGALGYELGGCLERLPTPKHDALQLPQLSFGLYDTVAVFDQATQQAWIISHADDAEQKIARFAKRINQSPQTLPVLDWTRTAAWQADQSRAEVERTIQRVIDYICAGDLFQANVTQRFTAPRPAGLTDFDLYRRLRELSPAPFASFLRCGEVSLASASPERFLRLGTDRDIEAQPIKGTRPRAPDPAHDAALAEELRTSAKDRAENLMIVDLMRSDLSRVAELGSVSVPKLCALDTFASVHHLVSTIEARLRDGLNPIDLLRATFPGGSITGAPKIRAMEIIHELEPAPRGFYCGSIGWIGFDGAMEMSMTIRTLTLTPDLIIAQAGGGITADSNPVAEYDESMTKLAPLLHSISG